MATSSKTAGADPAAVLANGVGNAQSKAQLLSEALPYMLRYENKTVVVKYGGHAMGDPELARAFARDIVMLKLAGVNPVVVHGGGPQIGAMLDRLNIKSEFRGGLRVTDKPTVEIVEMVLAGAINKQIVSAINMEGGKAVGICGKDANLVIAKKLEKKEADPDSNIERVIDLGYVGDPETVNPYLIEVIVKSDLIPVVAPVAVSAAGETLNVNADTFATELAIAMKAERLLMLTDVPGVLDKEGKLITELSIGRARELIKNGTISGGMIPKVEGCFEVVEAGVKGVVIMNGKVPHCVLLELFTEHGSGTLVTR
jgi:acetylglutamate kinase